MFACRLLGGLPIWPAAGRGEGLVPLPCDTYPTAFVPASRRCALRIPSPGGAGKKRGLTLRGASGGGRQKTRARRVLVRRARMESLVLKWTDAEPARAAWLAALVCIQYSLSRPWPRSPRARRSHPIPCASNRFNDPMRFPRCLCTVARRMMMSYVSAHRGYRI